MLWAFDDADCDNALDKLVLLALADEADDNGGSCFPSIRRIATRTRLSQGAVRNHVATLEAAGLIEVYRPPKTGRGHHNRYQLLMPRKGQEARVSGEETRTNARPGKRIPVDPNTSTTSGCVDCGKPVTTDPATGEPNPRCKPCHVAAKPGRPPAAQRPVGPAYQQWQPDEPVETVTADVARQTLSEARRRVQVES